MTIQIQPIPIKVANTIVKNKYEQEVLVNLMDEIDTAILYYKDTPPSQREKTEAERISKMVEVYNRRSGTNMYSKTWWL